jgi:DNA-binding response OmpR family regulator
MGKKILVADDSPTIRKMAESLLKKHGYEVLCAQDGASALAIAKTDKPDLIFWDASLPMMDGYHIGEELKGNEGLKDIPVIVLLTRDQMEKKEELKRIGADNVMVKPFNPKDILETVERFFKREIPGGGDERGIHQEQEQSKSEFISAEEKHSIDKTTESTVLSEEEEKPDDSLDILETSDFLESLEAPPPGPDAVEQHGFEWFMSEMKKEMEKIGEGESGMEAESKEEIIPTEITTFEGEGLKKEEKDKKEAKVYEIDKDQKGYEDFLDELKKKPKEPEAEKSLDHKIPTTDYDKMIQDLIENVSTKVAQEVARKIDWEILKKTVRDEVEKLRKEGIKVT